MRGYNPSKMANPNQKKILLEQTYEEIKEIWTKLKDDSKESDMEVINL